MAIDVEQITPIVTLTGTALGELRKLVEAENRPEVGLRVFVSPGGCSGLSYGMSLEDATEEGDELVTIEGLRVIVDEFSANFIRGGEIDYVHSLMGAGFTVHNPNAVKSCACGQSFDTGANASTAQKCSS